MLAKEQYRKRHDSVCTTTLQHKQGNRGATGQHQYEHVPKSVETSQGDNVAILRNQQVQVDRTTPNNNPDIIIRDNEKGICMLIDVAISGDRNVIKKKPRRF